MYKSLHSGRQLQSNCNPWQSSNKKYGSVYRGSENEVNISGGRVEENKF